MLFSRATFDYAEFRGATFTDRAQFDGATFAGLAAFNGTTFADGASFIGATFSSHVWFDSATFANTVMFTEATFGHQATFIGATFGDLAFINGATFANIVMFTEATFGHQAFFDRTTFSDQALFDGATFRGNVSFQLAVFHGNVTLGFATLEGLQNLGSFSVGGLLDLDACSFLHHTQIEVSARSLSLMRTRFTQGVVLRVRWAEINLDLTDFGAPSVVSGSPPFRELSEDDLKSRVGETRSDTPRLVSLRGANVAHLVVSNADLRACRFGIAHNLDRLRIEGETAFAYPPRGRIPRRRWTRRKTIAEEHQWRARRAKTPGPIHSLKRLFRPGDGWNPRECQPSDQFTDAEHGETEEPAPRQLAAIYRALRKGREDSKDAPGAADFYYGEMEMRRNDIESPRAERWLLWLYWLTSGYGLRASRSFACLITTVLVISGFMYAWGFPSESHHWIFTSEVHTSFATALTFCAQSTIGLFRQPTSQALTRTGEWLEIALRVLGPVFIGLAVLSLRGRVKR
ncbi:MAG: pentapeptide repeat-containing protein [Gaiellaceae bacterium]